MASSNNNYQVKANEFLLTYTEEEINTADILKKSDGTFHVINDFGSVTARITESDVTGKKVTIEIEGEKFELEIKDELDLMLEKMGFGVKSAKHIKEIKAPMPGLVLDIAVKEGQSVQEGEKVLILEAMKMENSILIHANATIKKINVKVGQPVEKGQILIELE